MYVCVCVYIYIVYRFFSIEQFTMCTTETVHFRNVAITLVCVLECYSDSIPIHALTPNVRDVDKWSTLWTFVSSVSLLSLIVKMMHKLKSNFWFATVVPIVLLFVLCPRVTKIALWKTTRLQFACKDCCQQGRCNLSFLVIVRANQTASWNWQQTLEIKT